MENEKRRSFASLRRSSGATGSHSKRSGFTLLELLLVMAIMIVVAAIAAPAVQHLFSRQALQKGADRMRVAMGQARVKAIRNGEEYAVYYTPQGSWFNVAPFTKFGEQAGLAGDAQKLLDTQNATNFEENLLPLGVKFTSSESSMDSRATAVIESGEGDGSSVSMILFYPDGTSQDAVVLIENEHQFLVKLQLRGLTGLARTVRVGNTNQ